MSPNEVFAAFLEKYNKSQADAVREMGLDKAVVSQLVNGKREFTHHYLGVFFATYVDHGSPLFLPSAETTASEMASILRQPQTA